MKTRNGFVSNSSSSSFIVGIAEIADKAKFDAYIEKNNIALDEYDKFIFVEGSDHYGVRVTDTCIRVDNFETDVIVERKKLETMYFVVNISNDEGDNPFWSDVDEEMNYDIDIDYFAEEQQKVYKMFSDVNSGLNTENDVRYGAARNG